MALSMRDDPFWSGVEEEIEKRTDLDKQDYSITCYIPLRIDSSSSYNYSKEEIDSLISQISVNSHCQQVILCLPKEDALLKSIYPNLINLSELRTKPLWQHTYRNLANLVHSEPSVQAALLKDVGSFDDVDAVNEILIDTADYLCFMERSNPSARPCKNQVVFILDEMLSNFLEYILANATTLGYVPHSLIFQIIEKEQPFNRDEFAQDLVTSTVMELLRRNQSKNMQLAASFLVGTNEALRSSEMLRANEILSDSTSPLSTSPTGSLLNDSRRNSLTSTSAPQIYGSMPLPQPLPQPPSLGAMSFSSGSSSSTTSSANQSTQTTPQASPTHKSPSLVSRDGHFGAAARKLNFDVVSTQTDPNPNSNSESNITSQKK